MSSFTLKNGVLHAEDLALPALAAQFGTPAYIYSRAALESSLREFHDALGSHPAGQGALVCYAVKANSNLAVLRIFTRLGGGVDVVSGGEIFRAMKAGCPPERIVYSGVGKRPDEIEYALEVSILMSNVESTQELLTINRIAEKVGRKAPVSLRVNPDVDPRTHPYISTGLKKNKFGIDIKMAMTAYRLASQLPHVQIVGIDCHIGSQLVEAGPVVEALRKLKQLVENLKREGMEIRYLDLGGGLGITYEDEEPPHPVEYASTILEEIRGFDRTLILEPGRVIVGNAGILVSKVL